MRIARHSTWCDAPWEDGLSKHSGTADLPRFLSRRRVDASDLATHEEIIARATADCIAARAAGQDIITDAAIDMIVALATLNGIITAAAISLVSDGCAGFGIMTITPA